MSNSSRVKHLHALEIIYLEWYCCINGIKRLKIGRFYSFTPLKTILKNCKLQPSRQIPISLLLYFAIYDKVQDWMLVPRATMPRNS